jgi:putative chitinase
MITAKAIIAIAPAAAKYADELVKQMAEAGIQANVKRAAGFLGQVAVESQGFTKVRENLNYSAKRMAEVWPGRYAVNPNAKPKDRQPNARALKVAAGGPEALANDTYGGRMGNTKPGSGWATIGRGLKMVTGTDNYRAFSKFWLGDFSLLDHPERLEQPDGAVASAIWFWVSNNLNAVADKGTVADITRVVQGGSQGLVERQEWTDKFAKVWTDKADFSGVTSRVLK